MATLDSYHPIWRESSRRRFLSKAVSSSSPVLVILVTNSSGVFDSVRQILPDGFASVNVVECAILHPDFVDFFEDSPAKILEEIEPVASDLVMDIISEIGEGGYPVLVRVPATRAETFFTGLKPFFRYGYEIQGLVELESPGLQEDLALGYGGDGLMQQVCQMRGSTGVDVWSDLSDGNPIDLSRFEVVAEKVADRGGSERRSFRIGSGEKIAATETEVETPPGSSSDDRPLPKPPPPTGEVDARVKYRRSLQEKIREAVS